MKFIEGPAECRAFCYLFGFRRRTQIDRPTVKIDSDRLAKQDIGAEDHRGYGIRHISAEHRQISSKDILGAKVHATNRQPAYMHVFSPHTATGGRNGD